MKLHEVASKNDHHSLVLDIVQDALDRGEQVMFDAHSSTYQMGNDRIGWQSHRHSKKGRIERFMADSNKASVHLDFSEGRRGVYAGGIIDLQTPVDDHYELTRVNGVLTMIDAKPMTNEDVGLEVPLIWEIVDDLRNNKNHRVSIDANVDGQNFIGEISAVSLKNRNFQVYMGGRFYLLEMLPHHDSTLTIKKDEHSDFYWVVNA